MKRQKRFNSAARLTLEIRHTPCLAVADRRLPLYLGGMKFRISYFAKPSGPGVVPVLLAAPTRDFGTVDDARKAAVADADNPKIGPVTDWGERKR